MFAKDRILSLKVPARNWWKKTIKNNKDQHSSAFIRWFGLFSCDCLFFQLIFFDKGPREEGHNGKSYGEKEDVLLISLASFRKEYILTCIQSTYVAKTRLRRALSRVDLSQIVLMLCLMPSMTSSSR